MYIDTTLFTFNLHIFSVEGIHFLIYLTKSLHLCHIKHNLYDGY